MYIQDLDEHEFLALIMGSIPFKKTLVWGFELAVEAEEQNALVLKERSVLLEVSPQPLSPWESLMRDEESVKSCRNGAGFWSRKGL